MTEQKQPQPGEWWRSDALDENAFICGFDWEGDPVFQTDDESPARIDRTKEFCEEWHHEPDCTGFDWTPPPAIDPGEGWELLPVGTRLRKGDQCFGTDGRWVDSWRHKFDESVGGPCTSFPYRRRKPAEWPKYYIRTSGADSWVYRADGRYTIRNLTCNCVADPAEWYWRHGNMVEVTESEALARVAKPAQPADMPLNPVPGKVVATGACKLTPVEEMDLSDKPVESITTATVTVGEIKFGSQIPDYRGNSPDDWVEITDPEHVLRRGVDQLLFNQWSDVHESNGNLLKRLQPRRCRCRRRDLPAAKPKRIPVRLYWYDGNIVGRYDHSPPTDPSFQELLHDANGFYVTEGER